MPNSKRHPFFDNAILLFTFVFLFWGVEFVDRIVTHVDFEIHGVIPREKRGLPGIIFAPFLHGDLGHLIGNTLPFLVLGGMVLLSGFQAFAIVTILSALVAGVGIWLFAASNTVHIGASTLVFGYLGFLLLRAWFSRDWRWAAIAIVAVFLYGGLVMTLFRHVPGVSWHGHAFGFLGGALAAKWMSGDGKPKKSRPAVA